MSCAVGSVKSISTVYFSKLLINFCAITSDLQNVRDLMNISMLPQKTGRNLKFRHRDEDKSWFQLSLGLKMGILQL